MNSSGVEAPEAQTVAPRRRDKSMWLAAGGAVVIVVAVLALWPPWQKPTAPAARYEVGPAAKMTFVSGAGMAISPDGRWMVFPARGEDGVVRDYLRSLTGVALRALPGTEGSTSAPPASWSYDSRWVVFANGSGKLKKVDILGGPALDVAGFPGVLSGASWSPEGIIIAGSSGGEASPILGVRASGGGVVPVTVLDEDESAHEWPQFLPDGKHFLYERVSSDPEKTGIYIGSIEAAPNRQSRERLLAADRQAYYAASPGGGTGHLIFLRQATLMAQAFDPATMTLSGEATAIVDGVDSSATKNYGLFSVSDTGTLVYRGGFGSQTVLTWIDLQGNPAGTLDGRGDYSSPAISPDGSRVAVAVGAAPSQDIWILDVAGGASTRFTSDPGREDFPAWSPDGKTIAFSSERGGKLDLYAKPADGSGEAKLLLKSDEPKSVERWTNDGRFLLFDSTDPTSLHMWALPMPGGGKPLPLLQSEDQEGVARVSPDGRWMAYTSTESGTPENFVRPFAPGASAGPAVAGPGVGGPGAGRDTKWQVSNGGGIRPLWAPDGKTLYYIGAGPVMAVDVHTDKGFEAGMPRSLFMAPAGTATTGWDITPDGKRFLFAVPPTTGVSAPFTVVPNWAAGLKK